MNMTERDDVIRRLERLEREGDRLRQSARRWRGFGLITLVMVVAMAAVGAAAIPPGQEDRESSDPEGIVREHRDLASRSLETINQSFERGVAESRLADAAYLFSYRMLSAELYLGLPEDGPRTMEPELYLTTGLAPSTPSRLASFEAHRDRMLRWEERFRPLARDRIVSPLAFAELQSRRLEAEAWLARERLRAAGAAEDPSP
jgi:hypothetical protein